MIQLYYVEFNDGEGLYMNELEYDDFARAMELLSVEYTATVIDEPMYAIHWYDYIDEEWDIIWCSPETFDEEMCRVQEAEVEWHVETYNMYKI